MKKSIFILITIFIFSINISTLASTKVNVKLSKCVDGDTARIILKDEEIIVRFIGIDTPESVHPTKENERFGIEASDYTCRMLKKAKKIQIEYDPECDRKDKFERHLVWIFVDNELLQVKILSKGYAKVDYLYGKYLYTQQLKDAEAAAKKKKIGIWSLSDNKKNTEEKIEKSLSINSGILNDLQDIIDKIYEIFTFC